MSLYFLPGPTILAGQSVSGGVDCSGSRIIRLVMPDDWTPASLTFQLSPDGVAYYNLFHAQPYTDTERPDFVPYEVMISSVVPNAIFVMPVDAGGLLGFVRFRSGTASRPVTQSAIRRFQLVLDVSDTAMGVTLAEAARLGV